jgi:sec-independent protein translocase protein TatB
LLVFGPEQIPKVIRTLGFWLGRAKRIATSIRADFERELRAEEMREYLQQQKLQAPLEELIESSKEALTHPLSNSNVAMQTKEQPPPTV